MTEKTADPSPEWVESGAKAPDFTLRDDQGRKVKLSELRGKPVVLYFYPKDDTPGCTKEACSFRDRQRELAKHGATVLGVSPDTVESHVAFRDKFEFPFPLLSDTERRMALAYGAADDADAEHPRRAACIVDGDGRILHWYAKVDARGFPAQALDLLQQ